MCITHNSLLKKRKFLAEKEAVKFIVDVLTGFLQLIKHGIIHRDLKPANILIDKGVSHHLNIIDIQVG